MVYSALLLCGSARVVQDVGVDAPGCQIAFPLFGFVNTTNFQSEVVLTTIWTELQSTSYFVKNYTSLSNPEIVYFDKFTFRFQF
jgi:hypothetical protein